MLGNSRAFSYSPRGFPQEDFPQRPAFHQDEPRESLQRNSMLRPSGRSIYKQRREYAESLNRNPDSFEVRVEHLFICELDGHEVETEEDCVTKLKRLDGKGRLWPQEMILEIKGAYLLLCDIETKAELDSIPLKSILKTRAVLDSGTYNSLLTITVQELRKQAPQVYMFQCEETGAEIIKADLDKALQRGGSSVEPRRMTPDISRQNRGGLRQSGILRPMQQEDNLPPTDYQAPQWDNRQRGYTPEPNPYSPQEEFSPYPDLQESDMGFQEAEINRNTEIFNHVLNDLEIFMTKFTHALNSPREKDGKNKKKLVKKKKANSNANPLPHWQEYTSFLQKIKYGFNLLGQLDGFLKNPNAIQYVHFLFSFLGETLPLYPPDLPPTIVSPLLTQEALRLLHQVVNPQEKRLWINLGDSWSIPRSSWPDDVEPYTPEFYDGWQLPAPLHQRPDPRQNRNNSQRFPPGGQNNSSRPMFQHPDEPMSNSPMNSPPPQHPTMPPLYMRVMYSFSAKNIQELTVMQGEVVQVVQKSRQWWLVQNSRNEEGNVPPNILESVDSREPMEEQPWDSRGQVTLDYNSTPADVTAWLKQKGFTRITISSLGVLTGRLLLGMTKDEIRTVCPEEAGKVFYQLQPIKTSLALSSEPSQTYNNRY